MKLSVCVIYTKDKNCFSFTYTHKYMHTCVCVCELGYDIKMSFLPWSQSRVFLKVSIVLIPFPVGRWVWGL